MKISSDPLSGPVGSLATNLFDRTLSEQEVPTLRARAVTTLQVNVGKLCNQACKHCHVDAGPHHTAPEVNMGAEVAGHVLRVLRGGGITTLDLTGGAPELNPHFRGLVRGARSLGVTVIDRCNLSVLFEPGQEDLGGFLAKQRVAVTASLPFYSQDRTDRQRGTGVFDKSVEGLRQLNELGYGAAEGRASPDEEGDEALQLNLVYNPVGAYLPGDQQALEADYRRELRQRFGIRFDQLFCITNMPIHRFLDWLRRSGNEERYMQTLLDAFNPHAVADVMCRDLVSVAPDGTLYDCDFNQMLGWGVSEGTPANLRDFDGVQLAQRTIVTGDHCLGCTAGAGSSCGGQLS